MGVRWLRLHNVPLLRQLQLEESLFRAPSGSWVVTNTFGSAGYEDEGEGERADGMDRRVQAIAMGISGKPELLLNESLVREQNVPILRRFTGGGTVVIDRGSLMVSLISGTDMLPAVGAFPNELMSWTATQLYRPMLRPFVGDSFGLSEQDYCIGDRKCAGNAQAISGARWVHHTSFLWDFDPRSMALLTLPAKRPKYRADRSHGDFLVGLGSALPSRRAFWNALERSLGHAFQAPVQQLEVVDAALLEAIELEARARATETRIKSHRVEWPP